METLPFASKVPQISTWGYSSEIGGIENATSRGFQRTPTPITNEERNCTPETNYEYMPAVLLNSLNRDKKPFTYTPGRVDLSEVLNKKLHKRLERQKVKSPLPEIEPQKQVLVMPTYNSPLNMYSMENALEALEVQAEYTVSKKNSQFPISNSMTLPRNYKYEARDFEPKNVTQSKAFRVLQIITDTEEDAEPSEKKDGIIHNDELRFSGVRDSRMIPSKLFHNLQKITDTEPSAETHSGNTGNFQPYHVESAPKLEKTVPSMPKFAVQPYNNETENYPINPILKRPAAFLPANSKNHSLPFAKYCSTSNMQQTLNKGVRPYEGTDF